MTSSGTWKGQLGVLDKVPLGGLVVARVPLGGPVVPLGGQNVPLGGLEAPRHDGPTYSLDHPRGTSPERE